MERENSRIGLPEFFILYLCIWTISPPMQIGTIYRLAALVCAGGWILSTGLKCSSGPYTNYGVLFIGMVVVVAIIEYSGFSKVLSYIGIYLTYIGYLMVRYYINQPQKLKPLIPIVLVFLIFWNYRTISALIADSHAMRYVVRNDATANSYLAKGVGGYGLLYSQVCVFPAVIAWVIKIRKTSKVKFIIGCLWTATYALLILEAGYTIAVVATVLSLYVLFFKKKGSALGIAITAIVLCVLGMLILMKSTWLQNLLLNIFDGTTITKKINDLISSAQNGAAEGSIASRMNAYLNSLKGLINYPIIGGLFWGGGGGHSALLDAFAKYGWFGGCVYYGLIMGVPKHFMSYGDFYGENVGRAANSLFTAILMVALLDTMPYQFSMMITVMPLALISEIAETREIMQ